MSTTLPDITDATRREFIALLGAAGLLTACGSSDDAGPSARETISVEHAGGTTEVPIGPQRIVTVDGFVDLQTLLLFGVDPVLAGVRPDLASGLLAGRLTGVGQIEERGLDNLEVVAAARPDLILSAEYDTERYDTLSGIAPTVLIDRYGASVDDHIRLVGRVLGRDADAERYIAEHRDRIDDVRRIVDQSPLADLRVGVFSSTFSDGTFDAFGPMSYGGRTLTAVGVRNIVDPGGTSDGDDLAFGSDLSIEELGVLGPAELLIQYRFAAFEGSEPIESQSLWPNLPAVRAGAVVTVESDVWYQDTVLSRLARLDDIERIATGPLPGQGT